MAIPGVQPHTQGRLAVGDHLDDGLRIVIVAQTVDAALARIIHSLSGLSGNARYIDSIDNCYFMVRFGGEVPTFRLLSAQFCKRVRTSLYRAKSMEVS